MENKVWYIISECIRLTLQQNIQNRLYIWHFYENTLEYREAFRVWMFTKLYTAGSINHMLVELMEKTEDFFSLLQTNNSNSLLIMLIKEKRKRNRLMFQPFFLQILPHSHYVINSLIKKDHWCTCFDALYDEHSL